MVTLTLSLNCLRRAFAYGRCITLRAPFLHPVVNRGRPVESNLSVERSALDAFGIGVWQWDPSARTLRASAAWWRQLGLAPHDGSALSEDIWLTRVHPADAARVRDWARAVAQDAFSGPHETHYRIRIEGGAYQWMRARLIRAVDDAGLWWGSHEVETQAPVAAGMPQEMDLQLWSCLDHLPGGFLSIDRQWCFRFANEKAGTLLGTHTAVLLGRRLWEAMPEGEVSLFILACAEALREGTVKRFEMYLPASGRWLAHHIYPSSVGPAIYFYDVTAQKLEPAAARERERMLDGVLHSIGQGVVALDSAWRYRVVNDRAEALMATKRGALIGRQLWEAFPDVRTLPFYTACVKARATRCAVHMEQYYAGTGLWYRNYIYPAKDGGLTIVFDDISAVKRQNARHARLQARSDAVFEHAATAMWVCSREGVLTQVNRQWCVWVGRPQKELLGSAVSLYVHPDDHAALHQCLVDVIDAGVVKTLRVRMFGPDQCPSWIELHLARLPSVEPGRVPLVLGAAIDVSEFKQREHRAVVNSARITRFAALQAQALEEERARIAREIHDELGQAFTILQMHVGSLQQQLTDLPAATQERVHGHISFMQKFISHSIHAVRRLATELRPPLLDQLGVGPALEAHAREVAARAGLELELHVGPVQVCREEALTLFRIAQEALTNVVRHACARHLQVELYRRAEEVVLRVRDDGQGFERAVAQAPQTLGLLGIYERAAQRGGVARVESSLGEGTTVTVTLPLSETRTLASAP